MMNNDWRLQGQQEKLRCAIFKKIAPRRLARQQFPQDPRLFHEHCVFCWKPIESQSFAYCTLDEYTFVCTQCYKDFCVDFEWTTLTAKEISPTIALTAKLKHRDEQRAAAWRNPAFRPWLVECVCCHTQGYQPDLPQSVASPRDQRLVYDTTIITSLFDPLVIDEHGECCDCRSIAELRH